jgi:hypothetical protein
MKSITKSARGRYLLAALFAAFVLAVAVVSIPGAGPRAQLQEPVASGPDANGFIPEATILEIMLSMMVPSSEAVWDSVAYISTAEGTIDARPETDEDWAELRGWAVTMAEASNALLIPGRRVDQPGAVSDSPDELEPAIIQEMIANDRQVWIAFANMMHAAAMETIRVIDAKDVDGVMEVGGTIDDACEACHLTFWYPLGLAEE